jgi:transcriptional regulator with XRE-family HTH domain
MTAKNILLTSPPYRVADSLKRLGANLRMARLRRKLRIEDVAEKIGTGPRAVAGAEKGKPSTSAAVYIALLWAYDLINQIDDLAAPEKDEEGMALARSKEPTRARIARATDNEF